MVYRLSQVEVPEDDPFRFDALERRPLVEFLAALIGRTGGPFVLALDSPWGTGKTTLVRMLEAELKRQNFQCIYFNAWQVDYVTDPLVALVASVDHVDLAGSGPAATFRDHMKTIRRVTSLVAKRGAVAAAKALTVGALNLEQEFEAVTSELVGDAVSDIVDAFQKEKGLLEKFRTELEAAIAQLPVAGKQPTLVIFVDELDRCRPTFSIELLERIKHLFDVPNIVFVLSLDKKQLEASAAAVYGQGLDAPEYLRRFIDLEYGIPAANTVRFIESLFVRFNLNDIFDKRRHADLRSDRKHVIDFFTALADAIPLSLRALERCVTRLRVVLDQTPDDHYLDPILVAVLIVLRSNHPDLFRRLCLGSAAAQDVMEYLRGLPGGNRLIAGRSGWIIEAWLIAADENNNRKSTMVSRLKDRTTDEQTSEQHRREAQEILNFIHHIERPLGRSPGINAVAKKIDLAARLQPENLR